MTAGEFHRRSDRQGPNRLRVAMIVPGELESMTGNAVDVERWCDQASDSGFDLILTSQNETALPPGTNVVHAIHSTKGGLEAAILAANKAPLISSVCGSDIYIDFPKPEYRNRVLDLWHRSEAIVLWHQGTADDLVAIDRSLEPKLNVIGPSVRLGASRPVTPGQWGLTPEDQVVLLPASIRAPKDPMYAIAPLLKLREKFPRLQFLIAGVVRDPGYATEIREVLLANSAWAGFTGPMPRDELLGLMQLADVILNTSPEEGFSNSVLEAMVLGRPMVLRDNAGNRAAVAGAPSDAALFFSTPEELTRQVERVLLDKALATSLGNAAKTHAVVEFSEQRERATYANLYRSVAESWKSKDRRRH